MPNLAATLNAEIRRLARREAKALVAPLKKALAQLRVEVRQLNRDGRELAQKLAQAAPRSGAPAKVDPAAAAKARFSPKLIAKLRARLRLSLPEFAALLEASSGSVFNWEHGKARPNAAMKARLVAVRGMGKRAVKRTLKEKVAVKK